jgi:[acyl-carrier-protein] S-malonyltransferase
MIQKKIGLLFSGQGAQTVGMGKDLAAQFPAAASIFERADQILGRSLSSLAFEGPDEELTQTVNCQPALYVHGLACLEVLREKLPELAPSAAAGLSLGEFTAHAAAGTFDFETGLRLVARRAELMQEACDATNGSMAALIGCDENAVRDIATETDVDIANLNSPGQVVISGESAKVAIAVELAKERGVRRATMLNVAGAYHSRLMDSAYVALGEKLASTTFNTPSFPVVCNVDAIAVSEPDEIRKSLQEQVTGSVRWTESVEYMLDVIGIAGLVNRIRKGTPVVSISDPPSLQKALEVLA